MSVRHDSINDEETVPKHPPTNMSKLHLHDAASKHRKTLTFDVSHVKFLLHVFWMLYMCNKGHLMSPTFKKLTFLSRQKFHIFSVFLLPWPRLVVLETEINLLIFESLILQPQFSLFICTSNKPSKQAAKALEFEKKILVTKFQRLNLSAIWRSSNLASKVLAAININMQWKHKQQK